MYIIFQHVPALSGRCSNGKRISSYQHCNQGTDCTDGSDEIDCGELHLLLCSIVFSPVQTYLFLYYVTAGQYAQD